MQEVHKAGLGHSINYHLRCNFNRRVGTETFSKLQSFSALTTIKDTKRSQSSNSNITIPDGTAENNPEGENVTFLHRQHDS